MIEDLLHLPPVSLTPVANLELRISRRIFEKIRNDPYGILRGLGGNWTRSRKSRDTVPLRWKVKTRDLQCGVWAKEAKIGKSCCFDPEKYSFFTNVKAKCLIVKLLASLWCRDLYWLLHVLRHFWTRPLSYLWRCVTVVGYKYILKCICILANRVFITEAEFLDVNWDKSLKSFPPCYSQSPPPLSKSGLKLVCYVNIAYGFKSENSQDYAPKPQRKCMFMNSASV